MALYNARVNFSGAGSVTGSSSVQGKVPITSPSKYTESNRLGQVVYRWNIETGQKVIPGESFMVRGGDIGKIAIYSAFGSFRSAIYTYTLKYNLNGASSPSSIPNQSKSLESVSPEIQTISIQIGNTTPTKTNTTSFAGWATSSTSTSNLRQPNDYISHSFTPNAADQTYVQYLYAVWNITQSFNANGGTFPTGSTAWNPVTKKIQTGTIDFTIPAKGPTRTGYKFLGWSASSTATTPYIAASNSSQTVVLSQNRVWYAVWKKLWTITYNKGDATSGSTTTSYKDDGVTIQLKGAIFGKTGYTQTGWSKTQGGAKAYNLNANYSANADLSLYPFWTAKTYTLTYNANTGSNPPAAVTNIPYGSKVTIKGIENMGKTYYSFFKWNTKDNGTGTNLNPGDKITITGDVTLYAIWVRKIAIVQYKNADGEVIDSSTVSQGTSISILTYNETVPSGKKFQSWKCSLDNKKYSYPDQFTIPNIADETVVTFTPVFLTIAGASYPSYTTTVNGARVIYVPDYIKGEFPQS